MCIPHPVKVYSHVGPFGMEYFRPKRLNVGIALQIARCKFWPLSRMLFCLLIWNTAYSATNLTITPLLQSPRYYGHIFLARRIAFAIIFSSEISIVKYDHMYGPFICGRINGFPLYSLSFRISLKKEEGFGGQCWKRVRKWYILVKDIFS